jgi:CHAT domain-containing protein
LSAAVISDKKQHLVKLGASRDAIRSAGDALVEALRPPGDEARAREHLDELREALLTPLKPALGDATQLYLCLDGSMNRVPATLWPNSTFLTSPQALLRVAPPTRPLADSATWLLVHTGRQRITFPPDQDFPYSISNAFKDHALPVLPGAEKEIKDLFEAQPDRWAILRSESESADVLGEPSESVFVQAVADPPAVIHIAGHATLRDPGIESASATSTWWQGVEQPRVLWCSCLFFPDPEPAETIEDLGTDNLLFAAEVAGLDLSGTKLVTLSACETGTGLGPMSEGQYSLARAFHSAGARDVLSCTEPLPDASVAALMTPFYQRIAKGDDAAKAFWEEQQRAVGDDVTKLRQYGFFRLTRAWVKARE